LWLRQHNVDITVIEVQAYKEGEALFIQPTIIVPFQVSKFLDTGKPPEGLNPWVTDGRSWHLDKRCSSKTREMFLVLDKILQERYEIDGPRWNQKHYIAYRVKNYNWLAIITTPNILRLDFLVKSGAFEAEDIADKLGIVKFDKEEPLSDKLGLPSSVFVQKRNENNDRVKIRVKEGFNMESPQFLEFLDDAYKAFPK
jgi:hypothetical protein